MCLFDPGDLLLLTPNVTTWPQVSYSNAGDKPWQMTVLGGTQRTRATFSERGAAIC